jgi:hypothetical protein
MTDLARCSEDAAINSLLLIQGVGRTLEQRIERWKVFVETVETGYEHTIYDYLNDLDNRQILGKVLEVAPPNCVPTIRDSLAPLDSRYLEATVEPPQGDKWRRPGDDWYRHPRKLIGELKSDLTMGNA